MTSCQHYEALRHVPRAEQVIHILRSKLLRCNTCSAPGPNLWLCLDSKCMYVGCGEPADHSGTHAKRTGHCLILNLTSLKMWCEDCESEVLQNTFSTVVREATSAPTSARATRPLLAPITEYDDSDFEMFMDETQRPRGLTGLKNIGNTCYMNAALQALSNCYPLTQFFLKCPSYIALAKNPSLAKNYMKLMNDVWHKQRSSYVTPTAVLNSVKLVHPMFRGYYQQDSQEFLRCFMDNLHEELKHPIIEGSFGDAVVDADNVDDTESERSSVTDEQMTAFMHRRVPSGVYCDAAEISDTDYETCDSGLSSENQSEATESLTGAGAQKVVHRVGSGTGKHVANAPLGRDDSLSLRGLNPEEAVDEGANTPTSDHQDNVPSDSEHSECCSTVDPTENLIGDVMGDSCGLVKTSSAAKFETGAGELGATVSVARESESRLSGLSESSIKVNYSVPSVDSAISDDGSGLSIQMDLEPEACRSEDTLTLQLPKCDSARSVQSSSTGSKKSSPWVRETRANEVKPKKPVQYTSIISAIFDGKILSSVQCMTCLRVSSTNETFQDLSLPIPGKDQLQFIRASSGQLVPIDADNPLHQSGVGQRGSCADSASKLRWMSSVVTWPLNVACWMFSWFWGPVITLQDCLGAFFSADDLKGDNMYSCEKCKKLRNGVKYSKVLKLPEILCIHLKRFRNEYTFSSKISSYVQFPLEGLDMRPYLHRDCKDEMTIYDLVAVICHHGTAGGGHYTSYALNHSNLSWYEYDDQIVTEVDCQQVEGCEAYVLFYRKKNEQMENVRLKASDLAQSPEDSLMTFYISQQWITKFNTFAEPGPISNHDFLCRHGDVHPNASGSMSDLAIEISQSLWEYLHGRFGGGPAVNRLSVCNSCLLEAERLHKRQLYEKEEFLRLNNEFQEKSSPPCAVYALSMVWFREWENFVFAKTNEPPGPIDNSRICQMKSGTPTLLVNSDYAQMSEGMWVMLKACYGGGPDVLLRSASSASTVNSRDEDTAGDLDE